MFDTKVGGYYLGLWRYLKVKLYKNRLRNLEHLKTAIVEKIVSIPREIRGLLVVIIVFRIFFLFIYNPLQHRPLGIT